MSLTPEVANHLRLVASHLYGAANFWQDNDQAAFEADDRIGYALPMSLDELAAEVFAFAEGREMEVTDT